MGENALTPVSPNQQRFSSDLSPVTSGMQIAFSEKNLTGYQILPEGIFSPSETGLWWSSNIKIPTETMVKNFFLMTRVNKIVV
ncbi:MAG: hypothetical protein WBX01_10280 [Nitrososphaeraceae archaeon]|jgi:hypothetical protein